MNDTLRREAGIEAELEDPDGFGLENFTYKNRIIAETMFRHLEETNFTGLTVSSNTSQCVKEACMQCPYSYEWSVLTSGMYYTKQYISTNLALLQCPYILPL